jgi:hypothetical protein
VQAEKKSAQNSARQNGRKRPYLRNGSLALIAPGPAALSGIQVLLPHPQPNM